MKNILILGSGRSGTSMLAGLFAKSGYFMGESLYPGRDTNPKGFFESHEINQLNEDIIKSVTPQRLKIRNTEFFKHRPTQGQRWLSQVKLDVKFKEQEKFKGRIQQLTAQAPFCYKDPRLCYTLPVWKPYLDDTVFLVVFRHPLSTAKSMLKEHADMPYLHSLHFKEQDALKVWSLMYRHVLELHYPKGGKWMFLHYEQILSGVCHDALEKFVGVRVDRAFAEAKLYRNREERKLKQNLENLYTELCRLSGYNKNIE